MGGDAGGRPVRLRGAAGRHAGALLALDDLSRDVLWLCAAPELDARFGTVLAFLHGDPDNHRPTPRLIGALLADDDDAMQDVLAQLGGDAPLRRRGCLRLRDVGEAAGLMDRHFLVGEDLVAFLLEVRLADHIPDPRLSRREIPQYPLGREAAVDRIRAVAERAGTTPLLICGPDALDLLALAVARPVLVLEARAAADEDLLGRARLTAALEDRVLVFGDCERLEASEVGTLRARVESDEERADPCGRDRGGRGAAGGVPRRCRGRGPPPSIAERRDAWVALAEIEDPGDVVAKFRLSTDQIARAVRIARIEADIAGRTALESSHLDVGARGASRSALGDRAVRLTADGDWPDLVLPERQLDQLRSVGAYLRHRDQVLTEWGFERVVSGRLGLGVLFAGESGTGKTMAARVLASDLGLEIFAVNLATVVSKYVGETEQNLEAIFSAAEGSNAILLFDEADALFGRRSDVSDSHDRYANLEVAYLLQRIEAYSGAVILTTNLKQNLDAAFLRRFDFIVDFRFPEDADRRRLWRSVLPAEAPVADDIDFDFLLGDRFKLSGGAIRNCSVAAAFEAASAGKPIRMAHVVRAVAAEYAKTCSPGR